MHEVRHNRMRGVGASGVGRGMGQRDAGVGSKARKKGLEARKGEEKNRDARVTQKKKEKVKEDEEK